MKLRERICGLVTFRRVINNGMIRKRNWFHIVRNHCLYKILGREIEMRL
jgi:hypothetical protein